jgi:uncharacterized protein
VQRPQFSIPVRDLERSDQRRSWELPTEWLDWALEQCEAQTDGTPGSLEVYVKKTGREVLVKGEAVANVTLPCVRTMAPVPVKLVAPILLYLTPKAPVVSSPPGAAKGGKKAGRKPRGRQERDDDAVAGELLSSEEAGRDEYDGENVVLDEFVREHLLLELPLFPVRSDLPFDPAPATDTPPDEPGQTLDPRLAPLAALASQLQRTSKE